MLELILFIIGFLLGGIFGVVLMCVLQINRLNENYSQRKDDSK